MERSSDSHEHHNSMDGDEGRADTASATLSITDTYCSLPTPPPHSETMPHLPPTATALSETGRGRESTPLRDGSQTVEAEEPASVTSAADVDSLTAEVCLSRYGSYPPATATATADVVAVVVPQLPRHPSRHPSPPPPPFSTVQLYTPDAAAHVTPRPLSAAPHSLPVSSPASPLHRDVRGRSVGAGRTPASPAPSKAAAAAAVHRRPDDGSMLSCALPQLGTHHARSYPPPTYTAEAEEAPVSVRSVAATRRSRGVVRPLLVELLELESSGFITAAPHAASAPAAAATRAALVPRGSDGHSSPAAPPTPSVVVMSAATSPLGADGGVPSPPPPRPPSPPLSVPPSLPQRRPAHSHPSSLIPRWVYTMGDQLSSRLTEAAATPALQSVATPPHDASPHYPAAPAAAESTGGEVAALPVQLTDSEAQAARRRQHLPHNPNALHLPWLLAVRQGSSSSRTSAGESTTAATSGGAAGGAGGSVPLSARPTATTATTTTTTTTTAMTTAATSPSSTVSSPTPMSVGLQRQQWRRRESADSPSRGTRLHAETDVAETRTPGGDTAAPDVGGADTLIDDITGSFRRRPVMSAFASTDAVAAASVRSAHTQPHTLPAAYRNASDGDGSDGGAGRGGLLAAFPLLSSALSSDFHALMAQLGAGGSVHDAAAAVLPTTVATTTTATTAIVVESEYSYRGTTGDGSRGIFTPPPLPAISSAGSLSSDSVLPLPYFLPPSHLSDSPAHEVARDSANNDHDDHGDGDSDEEDEEGGVGDDRAGLWRMERAVQSTADAAVVDEEERSLASLYAAATMSASPSASSLRRPAE